MSYESINKPILVTGGAGFIGSNFVRLSIQKKKTRTIILDKLTYAGHKVNLEGLERDSNFEFVVGDIGDRERVANLVEDIRPAAIINFAAETHVDRSIDSPEDFIITNVQGVFSLLEAARAYLKSAAAEEKKNFRFLHISTDEVYGSLGKTGRFKENSAYSPNSPYAASKAAADHLVHSYHITYGLPTLLTNCSNNYGPYQFPEKLIPLMILNAMEGKPIPIYGDGKNVRDWIYVEDHCEGLWRVLTKGEIGETYNIGASAEHTNLEVLNEVCLALEELMPAKKNPALKSKGVRDYKALRTFVKDRPGHDRRYAIDSTKLKRELGWKPKNTFRQGIRKTVAWYLANQSWCAAVQQNNYQRERLGLQVE